MSQLLLQLRKYRKAHKPAYDREDEHKIMALRGTGWRKPNGLHSKMRHRYRGQPAMVEPGWGSPRAVRGTHGTGLWPVQVYTLAEIALIKPGEGAVIGSGVGARKRLLLIAAAEKQKVAVLNIKNPAEYAKRVVDARKVAASAKVLKSKVSSAPVSPKSAASSSPSAQSFSSVKSDAKPAGVSGTKSAGSSSGAAAVSEGKSTGKSDGKSAEKSDGKQDGKSDVAGDSKKETKKEFDKLLTKRDA